MRTMTRLTLATVIAVSFGLPVSANAENDYKAETEAWRAEREATLKDDDGWLYTGATISSFHVSWVKPESSNYTRDK